jgi:cytochrome c oxidase assembly protein subunit 15
MRHRLRFGQLAAGTTGMTLLLMLLGVLTAATGTGLSCQAQWPFCDGGLFPATVASVPEWAHRVWAMLTGFLILGVAAWAWYPERRPVRQRYAAGLAAALLPAQVFLGAVTVTFSGRIPGGYSVPVQTAHFGTALLIFGALAATAGWAASPARRSALRPLALAALLVPAYAAVSRGLLLPYSYPVQAASTGVGFALVAALVVAAVRAETRPLRWTTALALALLSAHLLLARALYPVVPGAETLYAFGTGAVVGTVLVAAGLAYRGPASRGGPGALRTR